MVMSDQTSTVIYERRVVGGAGGVRIRRYQWPPVQLNTWIVVMLIAASLIIGVFATFIQIQNQLELPVPWYFPYYITVASLVIVFILCIIGMITQRRLLPAVVFVGAFILLILWIVGMVIVSIELWGSNGSVNNNCQAQVWSQNPTGQNLYTLAWLQQKNICQSWQAVWAFSLVGTVFLIWVMSMAYQVFADS